MMTSLSRFPSRSLLLTAAVSGLALGGTLWVKPALAATATSNLTVSADVSAACAISTTALTFGNYDPTSSASASGAGIVTVTCTNGASAYVTLSQGGNAHPNSTDDDPLRRLTNGSDLLPYFLYQDTGSTIWGNTASTGYAVAGTGNAESLTVYGTIPPGQNVSVGNYTDTVTATVTY